MTLAEELKARGLVEHSSAPVEQILAQPRTVYLGIDPSSDSIQVGNLAVVLLMKRLGAVGHKLVFLVGGATGLIGDPKEKGERPLQAEETVAVNAKALTEQLKTLLGSITFEMVNNADWLTEEKLIPFLREVGKYFTVNDLVKRELIKKRLDNPDDSISFMEFSYALLQGYDYAVLNEKYGCDLEIGASDQWTNILSGVDLIHKKAGKDVYAFTMPLVTDATGKKFGKSEGNAVWLDPNKTSPFQFYQFWMNVSDTEVERYLKIYTFLPLEDITVLMDKHRAAPQDREAQETLARLVTEIVHGPAAAAQAAAATDALFGDTSFEELSGESREVAFAEAPSVELTKDELEAGYSLTEALSKGGLASSKSDARRLIEGKAIALKGQIIDNPDQKLYPGDLSQGHALIRKGKQGVLLLILK